MALKIPTYNYRREILLISKLYETCFCPPCYESIQIHLTYAVYKNFSPVSRIHLYFSFIIYNNVFKPFSWYPLTPWQGKYFTTLIERKLIESPFFNTATDEVNLETNLKTNLLKLSADGNVAFGIHVCHFGYHMVKQKTEYLQ